MNNTKRFTMLFIGLLGLVLLLSACSGETSGKGDDSGEPVTLTWFYNGWSGTLVDDQLEALSEEYPHITIEIINDMLIEDVLSAGTSLDLTAQSMGQVFKVMDLHLAEDLTALIDKHDFDLDRLAPGVLEAAKSYSEDGTLKIMPYELNNSVLLYNIDIFDRFGLDYPTDGLTWDDVTDITRQVTRFEDGVQYTGISYGGLNPVFKNQMMLTFIDDEAQKATLNTDGWKHWMEVMSAPYRIDGNDYGNDIPFFKEQTMAMRTGPSPLERLPEAIEAGLRWDAVTFPVFPGYEEYGSQMNSPFYTIVPTSKHKDAAFQVISYLLSDEIQTMNAQKGRVPVVDKPEVVAEFGKNLPFLEGTRYAEVIFKEKIAPPAPVSMHDMVGRQQISDGLIKVNRGESDINSILREIQEAADSNLAEAIKRANAS